MHCLRNLLACLVLMLAVSVIQNGSLFAQAPAKLPVPDAAARKTAAKEIKDLYGQQFAKAKTPQMKIELASELYKQGVSTKDDPASRYELLRIAQNIAAAAGDAVVAFQAIDQMDKFYKIDSLTLKYDTLITTAKHTKTKDATKIIVEKASLLIEDSLKKDKYDLAIQLGEIAVTAARRVRDRDLIKQTVERNKKVAAIAQEYEKVKKAFATLETKPSDSSANMEVGKFYCLAKGDWQKGLAMLALSSDATLKSLAIKELQGPKAADFLVLGNGWWEQSAKAEGLDQKQLQMHAAQWYLKALPNLTGISKVKVERRLEQIPKISSIVTIPTKGLVSHWSFDKGSGNTARDSVSNNHGKISGARWVKGVRGGALYFDGRSSVVTLGNPKNLNFTGQITIAAWIKPLFSTSGISNIVTHGRTENPNAAVFLRHEKIYQIGSWDGIEHIAKASIPSGDIGTWVHLAGVYDGGTWRLYHNGREIAAQPEKTGAVLVKAPWAIGALYTGKERFFNGAIDEVCIYNRGLSAKEITALAKPKSVPSSKKLTAKQLVAEFRRARSSPDKRAEIVQQAIALGQPTVLVLHSNIARELHPQLKRYRENFLKQAALIYKKRVVKVNIVEVAKLRQTVLSLHKAANFTEEMIIKHGDPAMKRLEEILVVDRKLILNQSKKIQKDRQRLNELGRLWEQCAIYLYRQLPDDGNKPKQSPSFERYLQGEEEIAVGLAAPMPPAARAILETNSRIAAKLDPEETRTIVALNLTRIMLGLSPLSIDLKLCDAARDHSNDMHRLGFFAHVSTVPGKKEPWDRAKRFGAVAHGENLFRFKHDGREANKWWFHSPIHHVLLIRNYKRVGVGKVHYYFTELFGY